MHAHSQQNGFSQAVLCHMILTNTFCFPVEKVYPEDFNSKEKNMSIKYESKEHDLHKGMGVGGGGVKIICCYIKSVACFSEWIVTVGLIRSHQF